LLNPPLDTVIHGGYWIQSVKTVLKTIVFKTCVPTSYITRLLITNVIMNVLIKTLCDAIRNSKVQVNNNNMIQDFSFS